ncbi:hypothetical protein Taro_042729 [Colocasia esculenta]|uniref:Uncharacterized protein n=1 Tax=Colocasia esculenta TaxID=4460 RepID=A0A843WQB5_COLES|nr:hypothetical protein [Colocasia esculenta]
MPSAPTSTAFLPYEIARPSAIQHFLLFYPNLPYVPIPILALPCADNLRQSPRVVAVSLAQKPSRQSPHAVVVAVALAPSLSPSRQSPRDVAGPTQTPCIAVAVAVALAPSPKQTPCIAGVNCPSVPGHQGTPIPPTEVGQAIYYRTTGVEDGFKELVVARLEDWKSQLNLPRARIVELAAFPSQPHSRHFQRGTLSVFKVAIFQ